MHRLGPSEHPSIVRRITALGRVASDPRGIARAACELAVEISGLEQVAIVTAGQAERPELLANLGVDEDYLAFLSQQYMNLPGAQIIADAEPMLVPDVAAAPAYERFRTHYDRAGIRGLALFPMRLLLDSPASPIRPEAPTAIELFGVLALYHPRPYRLEPTTVALLQLLAEHTTLAIATRRIHSQREYYKHLAVIERSQEALNTLAAGVVHDLNNVLGALLGVVELLPRMPEARRDQLLDRLGAQILHASGMTRSLLALSRPKAAGPAADTCEILALVTEGVTLTRATAHPETRIVVETSSSEVWARVSPVAFSRIVLNLLLNAAQALGTDRGKVVLRVAVDGEQCVVEVDDDGPGIAEERRAQVFEPFASFGKGKGTGVGLTAARGLAEQAGGSLVLRSRPGPGACFTVRLPLAAAPAPAAARSRPEPSSSPNSRGRVVLAEDEPIQRQIFSEALCAAGFAVATCANAAEALDAVAEAPVVAAVLAQRLPDATGHDLFRRLRVTCSAPVVMLSGVGADEPAPDARELQGLRFVQKPISGQALAEALAEILASPV